MTSIPGPIPLAGSSPKLCGNIAAEFAESLRLGIATVAKSPNQVPIRRPSDNLISPIKVEGNAFIKMSNYKINADDISWTQVDDEIVIIDLETTHYYSLNNTGAYIWQLLDSQIQSEKELIEKTASYFDQAPETISRDVQAILEQLKAENLILER